MSEGVSKYWPQLTPGPFHVAFVSEEWAQLRFCGADFGGSRQVYLSAVKFVGVSVVSGKLTSLSCYMGGLLGQRSWGREEVGFPVS